MRKSIGLVFTLVLAAVCCRADSSGPVVLVRDFPAWKEVEALEPGGQKPGFPTMKYVPRDGRNAAFIISYIGKGKITDLTALKSAHEAGCVPYAVGPNQHYETKEIKLPHGRGVYSIFEDPALIGKPPIRENYKFTAPIDILFDNGAVAHATILTDERAGHTLDEAMAICLSCDLKREGPVGGNSATVAPSTELLLVSTPSQGASLGIPKQGLVRGQAAPNVGDSYFLFSNAEGIVISAWLEDAAKFPGFRKLWETDKAKMEAGTGFKLQDEKLDVIGGWQAVTYAVRTPDGLEQWNIRACRTSGHTWIDVHLSSTARVKPLEALKTFLKKMTVQPKGAGGAI